jgi:hypothetical protein
MPVAPISVDAPVVTLIEYRTLYVLVVVAQGAPGGFTFSPGYTREECLQQYKGPNVSCFDYDPEGSTWTAFFRLAFGGWQ